MRYKNNLGYNHIIHCGLNDCMFGVTTTLCLASWCHCLGIVCPNEGVSLRNHFPLGSIELSILTVLDMYKNV